MNVMDLCSDCAEEHHARCDGANCVCACSGQAKTVVVTAARYAALEDLEREMEAGDRLWRWPDKGNIAGCRRALEASLATRPARTA